MTNITVVFDLDGTLIDTAPDLVDSLNYVIGLDGLAPVQYSDLTYLVGHGAKVMIERAFKLRDAHLSQTRHDEMLAEFIAYYQKGMPGQSKHYPGLHAALERLKSNGMILAVCTNKLEGLARPLISGLELDAFFPTITGGDTFAVRKPDAFHLTETIRLAGGTQSKAVMIGDSLNDILVARNARVPSIAVPFGYSDVPVADLEPDHIIDHFDQLTPELITEILSRSTI